MTTTCPRGPLAPNHAPNHVPSRPWLTHAPSRATTAPENPQVEQPRSQPRQPRDLPTTQPPPFKGGCAWLGRGSHPPEDHEEGLDKLGVDPAQLGPRDSRGAALLAGQETPL